MERLVVSSSTVMAMFSNTTPSTSSWCSFGFACRSLLRSADFYQVLQAVMQGCERTFDQQLLCLEHDSSISSSTTTSEFWFLHVSLSFMLFQCVSSLCWQDEGCSRPRAATVKMDSLIKGDWPSALHSISCSARMRANHSRGQPEPGQAVSLKVTGTDPFYNKLAQAPCFCIAFNPVC